MEPSADQVTVIGGGPAGLMAAEVCARAGLAVELFDAMPGVGRKFLVAGRGGLNLTHSEPLPAFIARYGANAGFFARALAGFPPDDLRAWAHGLGIETFVGSSGRVFPRGLRAAPLLRAWILRLRALGVTPRARHRWLGFADDGSLRFAVGQGGEGGEGGEVRRSPAAAILALGGASWPRTGSDGGWTAALAGRGVRIVPFAPANCGVDCAWSEHFIARCAGAPLKNLGLECAGVRARGEIVITRHGLEGGGLYALGPVLRERLATDGRALVLLDFKPDLGREQILARLGRRRGKDSRANAVRKALNLPTPAWALLREVTGPDQLEDDQALASLLKALPVPLTGLRPLAEAISSSGGIAFDEVDERLMLRRCPGLFVAGEMLDWEAPTGGYLLQGAFSTGHLAAEGVRSWLRDRR